MTSRRRFSLMLWLEGALSVIAGILAVITAIVPDWIERLTGAHPDSGKGEFEWVFVLILAVVSLVFGYAARRNWRSRCAATA